MATTSAVLIRATIYQSAADSLNEAQKRFDKATYEYNQAQEALQDAKERELRAYDDLTKTHDEWSEGTL